MPFKRPLGPANENQKPPNFIRPLQDKRFLVGQNVVFECQVDASPEPAIKWLKDGQNVTQCPDYKVRKDGQKCSLAIPFVQIQDGGNFTCQASNSAGSKSTSCTLIVAPAPSPIVGQELNVYSYATSPGLPQTPVGPSAPFFLKELKHQLLKPGINVSFECRVVGNPTPKIKWTRNDVQIESGYKHKIDNDPSTGICTLIIPMVQSEDAAIYKCMASNVHGVSISSAKLLPKKDYDLWMSDEQSKLTTQNRQYLLAASQNISRNTDTHFDPKTGCLVITERRQVRENVEGGGILIRESPDEYLSANEEEPGSPPEFLEEPKNLRLFIGDHAVFRGQLAGFPRPRIQWMKDGAQVLPSHRCSINYRGMDFTLQIKNVKPEDAGTYRILAQNEYGTATSQARLIVEEIIDEGMSRKSTLMEHKPATGKTMRRPQILKAMTDTVVKERQTVRFDVKVVGEPFPRIIWHKDGKALNIDDRKYRAIIGDDGWCTLIINDVDYNDRGLYTCIAVNHVGDVQCSAYLSVQTGAVPVMPVYPSSQTTTLVTRTPYPQHETPKNTYNRENIQAIVLCEGDSVTLRCRANGHRNASVAWTKNDVLLLPGRIKYKIDLGFEETTLTINDATMDDAGVYQCIVTSSHGTTSIKGQVIVEPALLYGESRTVSRSSLNMTPITQTPSIKRQQEEVGFSGHQREESTVGQQEFEAPYFVAAIAPFLNVTEMQTARFECKFEPAYDPSVIVKWLFEGQPLKASSRIKTICQFGFTALEISSVQMSDQGLYTCYVQNRMGSESISSTLNVQEDKFVTTMAEHPKSWQEIVALEDRKSTPLEDRYFTPDASISHERPRFFKPTFGSVEVPEGKSVHFESKFLPTNDPNLTINWSHDGRPLKIGSRIRTTNDFGFVSLDISQAISEDSGVYVCRIANPLGMAEISGCLLCKALAVTYEEPIQPAIPKQHVIEERPFFDQPHFLMPLKDQMVSEGRPAIFETRVAPESDPSVQVQWLKDEEPLRMANRISLRNEFGHVSVSITPAFLSDAGTYTCCATSNSGQAQVSARLIVRPDPSSVHLTGGHITLMRDITNLEQRKQHVGLTKEERPEGVPGTEAPQIVQSLQQFLELEEGRELTLACRFVPTSDPKLRVQWLKDDAPVPSSHRLKTTSDFGLATLSIADSRPYDSGLYTLFVKNEFGQTASRCNVSVNRERMPAKGALGIQRLEAPKPTYKFEPIEQRCLAPPNLLNNLEDRYLDEGATLKIELRVEPQNDPTMKVEWTLNGANLPIVGSRISSTFEFGYISLLIKGVKTDDAGLYAVRVKNELGEAGSSCNVFVRTESSIQTGTQHEESLRKIKYLERHKVTGSSEIESQIKEPPTFVKSLRPDSIQLNEGDDLHLEAHIKPLYDDTLKVEWYQNDRPLQLGSRFRTFHEFGLVSLDITSTQPADTGLYTCYIRNSLGEAYSQSQVLCVGFGSIVSETEHPRSLQQIKRLEAPKPTAFEPEELAKPPPTFVRSLLESISISESEKVDLQCQVIPADDSNLVISWLFNGQPLPSGHKFRLANDFGLINLTVLYAYPENSGLYTCRAENRAGRAETSCEVKCVGKRNMLLEPCCPASLTGIRRLEAPKSRPVELVENKIATPVFVTQPRSYENLIEGQTCHLECHVRPQDDPDMVVEWRKDGRLLESGHRFKPTFNFGYVSLDFLQVYAEDSGEYTCVARNESGSSSTCCTLKCYPLASIYGDTDRPESVRRIEILEQRKTPKLEEPDKISMAPFFTEELASPSGGNVIEGQTLHMQCKYQPNADPSVETEWIFNGQPLTQASRFRLFKEFGLVSLDILSVIPEDGGIYTVIARNSMGSAKTSMEIICGPLKSLYTDTQNVRSLQQIHYLEHKPAGRAESPEICFPAPNFLIPLRNYEHVPEGSSVILETKLHPVGDPSLSVQWTCNGAILSERSRFVIKHEFENVSLQILTLYPEDSGTYECRAINHAGECALSCMIGCVATKSILSDTQHESSLRRIHALEHRPQLEVAEPPIQICAPHFMKQLNKEFAAMEGDRLHLECNVIPESDPNLAISWSVNGRPLLSGHRFRPAHNFGLVALDVLYAFPEDSGIWTCRAENSLGSDQTSTRISVRGQQTLILDSQHPESLSPIRYLETPRAVQPARAEKPFSPPNFLSRPNDLTRYEGQSAHFETKVTPLDDPSLTIEWFKDGQPMISGNRFKTTTDFGYVSLDMAHVLPEDAGRYDIWAKSQTGEATVCAFLQVQPLSKLLLETQHPDSLPKIYALESTRVEKLEDQRPPKSPPHFVVHIKSGLDLIEGQPAHFEAQVRPIDDEELKIEWYHDGNQIQPSSRINMANDFGLVVLDILYCVAEDAGVYTCRAVNELGDDQTSGRLNCAARGAIDTSTIHVDSLSTIRRLEAPKVLPEPAPARSFPPPHFIETLTVSGGGPEMKKIKINGRVAPVDDPDLRVEWYFNGNPLLQSNRIMPRLDFGYVDLEIAGPTDNDSGQYVCKAVNNAGEATCAAAINISAEQLLLMTSLHPESFKQTQILESMDKFPRTDIPEKTFGEPRIVKQLENVENVDEGEKVEFECQVVPADDPNLKVEWFHNDNLLPEASRYKRLSDFGYILFGVLYVFPEDSGVYTCRISNNHGSACTSACLKVKGYESILSDTQRPVSWRRIQELEKPVVSTVVEPEVLKILPKIFKQSGDMRDVAEGATVRMGVFFEPADDDELKWEWSLNGQPIIASQLIKIKCELGHSSLEINGVNEDHNGVYTFWAKNSLGEASTSIRLGVSPEGPILSQPQQEDSWRMIQQLEAPRAQLAPLPDKPFPPPAIFQALQSFRTIEGEPSHFECQYQPADDPSLKVEWLCNGCALQAGSKYQISNDFGYATLDILYTYPEDSGVYVCQVTSASGQNLTSAGLECLPKGSIVSSTTHPESVEKIRRLEAPKPQREEVGAQPAAAPVFLKQMQNYDGVPEGCGVHFETFVEPKNDPLLKVSWFHNGKPVLHSSRFRMLQEFGFVVLDIVHLEPRDSGDWMCVAKNQSGQASLTAHILCTKNPSIIYDTQHPESVEKIVLLEVDKPKYEAVEPKITQAPRFLTHLPQYMQISEFQPIHFEAKVEPANDAQMIVEWFKDGVPLLQGNRFRITNDFGFCILDILFAIAEDTGRYTCCAKNELGRDYSQTDLVCAPGASLILTPQVGPDQQEAIVQLEENLAKVWATQTPEKPRVAPIFLKHLSNAPPLVEGDHAYFSAKLNQTTSPDLKIEWFFNGNPLLPSSRVKTISDFGFVILEISPVYPEDSGQYVCVASNDMGQDQTQANLVCKAKASIIRQSQLPGYMSGAQAKIEILEAPKPLKEPEPDIDYAAPNFVGQIKQVADLMEGQMVHFECQVEPAADPHLKIEWFHNGQPIFHSSRRKTMNDFGVIILEIAPVEPQDSGEYVCVATNRKGKDQTRTSIKVSRSENISYNWQLPEKAQQEQIVQLEDYLNRDKTVPPAPDKTFDQVKFVEPLKDHRELTEGQSVHLECKVEPIDDPNLSVQWFHNDHPLPYSSRIVSQNDFGYIILNMRSVIPEDSGVYTCRATNKAGQDETSCHIVCKSHVTVSSPYIISHLTSNLIEVQQGDPVHFECRIGPLTDPTLLVSWFFNQQPLMAGSRFRIVNDFGFASLDIQSSVPEDTGEYVCLASNAGGQVQTAARLVVYPSPSILSERQAPGGQTLDDLRRRLAQYTDAQILLTDADFYHDDDPAPKKPRFVTPIENATTGEGEFARFECQCAPVNDPKLKIEWFRNGQPITIGHRFLSIHDFGYVSLIILYALPEDTGEYTVRATNPAGYDESKAILICGSKDSIITNSQIPQGLSVVTISKDAEQLYRNQNIVADNVPKMNEAPSFTIEPRRARAYENEAVRFECAVSGYPKPQILWFINGRLAMDGPRYKLSYDGMHYLVVPHVQPQDAGDVTCVARNVLGECKMGVTLNVLVKHDFRFLKLNPSAPDSHADDVITEKECVWRQQALGSLGEVFDKAPKPSPQKLFDVETTKHPIEPLESEELLYKFQRKSETGFYGNVAEADKISAKASTERTVEKVKLRAARIAKTDLPREELEKVELRPVRRIEIAKEVESVPWKLKPTKKEESAEEEQQRLKLKPASLKEVDVPAKDQVRLKSVKPKPAEEPALVQHVILEKSEGKQLSLPAPQKPVADSSGQTLQRPDLRPAFQPKESTAEKVQLEMEDVQLKSSPISLKQEYKSDIVLDVKVPTFPQKTSKRSPNIIQPLQPQHVQVGKSAIFACQFDGHTPFDVTWWKNDQILKQNFEFQIRTNGNHSSLEIGKVKHSHVGKYAVKVSNVAGTAESVANLQVIEKPDVPSAPIFQQPLIDQTRQCSTEALFTVQLNAPAAVLWFKDGKQVMPDPRIEIFVNDPIYSLKINECLPQDSGMYECIARNPKGESRNQARLKVNVTKSTTQSMLPKSRQEQLHQVPEKLTSSASKTASSVGSKNIVLQSTNIEEHKIVPPWKRSIQPK